MKQLNHCVCGAILREPGMEDREIKCGKCGSVVVLPSPSRDPRTPEQMKDAMEWYQPSGADVIAHDPLTPSAPRG